MMRRSTGHTDRVPPSKPPTRRGASAAISAQHLSTNLTPDKMLYNTLAHPSQHRALPPRFLPPT
ncbi:hypothetical protein IG631_03351 [Alternaria alternata]|nr:hypothetical protein IG631_03351 [Alternaria alternata]